ncbi:IclR family transcriptional regulator [Cryobacterium flavum]|nr:IclR family transcriptional regulator C-terminal domain-containing protein [Cryobacterium flavum]
MQDENRLYWPGPSLGAVAAGITWTNQVRDAVEPHLETLVRRTGETANLMIRVGANVRIIMTVESSNVLRVTDRRGVVLPARHASGGKALFAELSLVALKRLYLSSMAEVSGDALDPIEFGEFLRELDQCRLKGYASNTGATEEGVGAIGVTLHDAEGNAFSAISLATPLRKLRGLIQQGTVREIMSARSAIEADLTSAGFTHPSST